MLFRRSFLINRQLRAASRESGTFMVSGIKVNKRNLSRRSNLLFNIKARESTLVTGVGYGLCGASAPSFFTFLFKKGGPRSGLLIYRKFW
jgi:hypothetical protein